VRRDAARLLVIACVVFGIIDIVAKLPRDGVASTSKWGRVYWNVRQKQTEWAWNFLR
jgi:hypothetical protein